jgi:hypothetical protein
VDETLARDAHEGDAPLADVYRSLHDGDPLAPHLGDPL